MRRNLQKIDYTFVNYFKSLHFGDHNQDWSTTGKGGIEYKWTPDIMTYATFSTGYKGQAYDLVSTFNAKEAAQMPVPHETAKNYEVGIKSQPVRSAGLLQLRRCSMLTTLVSRLR